jgi:hypothetical protein
MMKKLICAVFVVTACETLEPTPGPEDVVDGGLSLDGGRPLVTSVPFDGGVVSTITASDQTTFVAFDLDLAEQVPFEVDARWDLAFKWIRVRSRGGVSGDGGVTVAPLADAGFAEVLVAPTAGYLVDVADGDDPNTEVDTVFENGELWYSYNPLRHVVTPRRVTYVVKSDEAKFYKVSIEGFRDAAGTPGIYTLRWAQVPAP